LQRLQIHVAEDGDRRLPVRPGDHPARRRVRSVRARSEEGELTQAPPSVAPTLDTARMSDVEITRGSAADIPRLEPLWVAVHHHHQTAMPELGPYVSDEVTWREHRPMYEDLFRKPDTFLLLASVDGELIGYALVHVMPVEETWIADTWVTGGRIAELESLSVLPEHRGSGIGSRLMEEVHREIGAMGIEDVIIGALPGNEGALRLYERSGYR